MARPGQPPAVPHGHGRVGRPRRCRWAATRRSSPPPTRQVVPYVKQPDELLPGVPLFFATAYPQQSGVGLGLLVKQTTGRPIKVEGNPNHPGEPRLDRPDQPGVAPRPVRPRPRQGPRSTRAGPAPSRTSSPSVKLLLDQATPQAGRGRPLPDRADHLADPDRAHGRVPEAVPEGEVGPVRAGPSRERPAGASPPRSGHPANAVYKLDKAKVALALDCDFLGSGVGHVRQARDFMKARKVRTVPRGRSSGARASSRTT